MWEPEDEFDYDLEHKVVDNSIPADENDIEDFEDFTKYYNLDSEDDDEPKELVF